VTALSANGATPAGADLTPPVLEGRQLTKYFRAKQGDGRFARRGQLRAVDGVSLALRQGQVTAVVGESGSGKSVLSRMLARIVSPTSGELLLDGRPVPHGQRHRRPFAADVQLVLQDPFASMNPVHTVRHHLERPLRIHGTRGDDESAAIGGLLSRVALDPPDRFVDKYPHELSGGQLQRVSVARALAVQPRVLLADEPVSMLDVSIRLGVLNLLADLRDDERLAILYITHDIASARYLADETLVMYAGRVVERGPSRRLTDEPSHPYTQLLMTASPDPERVRPPSLQGRVVGAGREVPATGCPFRPRCPHAMTRCEEEPPEIAVGAGHLSRCWLAEPVAGRKEKTVSPTT
jgi:peptide/nickel transport system ATP-binding protein